MNLNPAGACTCLTVNHCLVAFLYLSLFVNTGVNKSCLGIISSVLLAFRLTVEQSEVRLNIYYVLRSDIAKCFIIEVCFFIAQIQLSTTEICSQVKV